MGDWPEDQGDDRLARDLINNTLAGKWQEVLDLYEKYKYSAILAKINTSGDTAFHIAVSIAAEYIVEELFSLISKTWERGLWIKNNDGNTPLHVAVTTGKFRICILIARHTEFSGYSRNKAGESPLFLAVFHGHKHIFLCLHMLLTSNPNIGFNDYQEPAETDTTRINPLYRRYDGETILHSAIRCEYFGKHFYLTFFTSPIC